MEYADNIRISDSEREQVVDELGRHLTAGRLTIGEFDQRVAQAYRSVTQAQARQVLRDLPAPTPTPAPSRTTPARRHIPGHQQIEWLAWLAAGSLNIAIWGIISLATGVMIYFWPVWVIGPWGLVLLSRTLLGREGKCSKITGTVRCNSRSSAAAHN
ncbi:DUF1707 SHOCT-like domain-containing protein [Rhodococcus tibetensis]|uniref:DUF1707 domain-containing protein n=1 Tax=Rhodococcus tibetensis TaxID=2965064 RepID=A0ABT1QHP9_9NOCA|nr:DUF1707 domain-containing protein [Rhodococcus sp. FXJ9.536]MCQ4120625.1 DUF1707 domain-containing protein [Rhodococcus sp. FXJ9.536]